MSILDRVAQSSSFAASNAAKFRPATPRQYIALKLARRLSDDVAVGHYAELLPKYTLGQLLLAYRNTVAAPQGTDLGRRFHQELELASSDTLVPDPPERLLSIRVERRAIAVAISTGKHLEYTQVRQLSYLSKRALDSSVGFVADILARFRVKRAALEAIPVGYVQRFLVTEAIKKILTERSISIWEVPRETLFYSFGRPPLRNRTQLRRVMRVMWPALGNRSGTPLIQDAVALGMYCQTEHLFNANDNYFSSET